MMHIGIFVYVSWGDIRPHVLLEMTLQEVGHHVQVVASPGYEVWVRVRNLGFYPLTADVNTFALTGRNRDPHPNSKIE